MKGIRRLSRNSVDQWPREDFFCWSVVSPAWPNDTSLSITGCNILPVLHDTLIHTSVDTILEFQSSIKCTVQISTHDTMFDTMGRNWHWQHRILDFLLKESHIYSISLLWRDSHEAFIRWANTSSGPKQQLSSLQKSKCNKMHPQLNTVPTEK